MTTATFAAPRSAPANINCNKSHITSPLNSKKAFPAKKVNSFCLSKNPIIKFGLYAKAPKIAKTLILANKKIRLIFREIEDQLPRA